MPSLVENGLVVSGTTAQRPTKAAQGQQFYDTTLGILYEHNGTAWVALTTSANIGAGAAAGSGVAATERAGIVQKTVIALTAASVPVTDSTGGSNTGGGGLKIYDFPEGNLFVLGATMSLSVTAGAGGITDTAQMVAALGTAAAGTDGTLSSTEADIIPSSAATLTGGANAAVTGKSTATPVFDGTATAKDLYLNFAVPDAGMGSGDDTVSVTGTVVVHWVNLGDV